MSDQIVNRVAASKLVTIDLEEFYPKGKRIALDISQWLYEGFVLREKEFRESLKTYNWSQFKGQYIALGCSTDAIVPSWAYLLISTYLSPVAERIVVGDKALLETVIYTELINNLPVEIYSDKPVIIKGCANLPVPETAKVQLLNKLYPVAKSIMFGEACSTVPLYKRKA